MITVSKTKEKIIFINAIQERMIQEVLLISSGLQTIWSDLRNNDS